MLSFLTNQAYIRQVNLDIEYFLRHYGKPGDRQFLLTIEQLSVGGAEFLCET